MSFTPASGFNNFVPNDLIIPKNPDEMNLVLTEYFRYIINAINSRIISIFDEQELASGEIWFNPANRQLPRYGLRKVINMIGLNNFTVTNPQLVPHNIQIQPEFVITRIYGAATDPSNEFIPLPYVDMTGGGNHIQLSMDATNVVLRSNFDYSRFTTAYVVLEYLKS